MDKIRINKILLLLVLVSVGAFLFSNVTLADDSTCQSGQVCLKNPLTGNYTNVEPSKLIGQVIKAVLGIVGSLALAMFIYGGFVWMTSSGNNERVQKGKNILVWATVGLIVIFSSYAVVRFILGDVLGLK